MFLINPNMKFFKPKIFVEGGEDGDVSSTQQNSTPKENNTKNDTPNNRQDTNEDSDNQQDQNNNPDQEEDMSIPDEEEGTFDDTDDKGTESSGDESTDDDSSVEADENDLIKQSEDELFANLTQVEIEMKHIELKKNFYDLYLATDKIIERINDIKCSIESIEIAEYISNSIANLRSMIYDYLIRAYDKKSYTESVIVFNKFLITLRGVQDLLDVIIKNKFKNEKNKQ